jgi:hypothetical protein
MAARGLRMLEIAGEIENSIDRLAARAVCTVSDVISRCGKALSSSASTPTRSPWSGRGLKPSTGNLWKIRKEPQ